MSRSPTWAMQKAVAAALLADAPFVALHAVTRDGPAIFARRQRFEAVTPRTTFGPPEVLPRGGDCNPGAEVIVTLHHWAAGDEATRIAGEMADAAIAVLDGGPAPLACEGHRVLSVHTFVSSRPLGDPDPQIEHIASVFRFLTEPA